MAARRRRTTQPTGTTSRRRRTTKPPVAEPVKNEEEASQIAEEFLKELHAEIEREEEKPQRVEPPLPEVPKPQVKPEPLKLNRQPRYLTRESRSARYRRG